MTIQQAQTSPLIRDLSDEEFFDRYSCDRLTANVLSSKFRYTVQHMCSDVLHTAFSSILRDWYDFAAALSAPASLDWLMPAVSNSLMLFLGTMSECTRNAMLEYGVDRLKPGDVVIMNDPYRGGTHVNDVAIMRPVFAGHDEPVCYLNVQPHLLDMGGIVPAGFSGAKLNVFENGLVISPRLLYSEDEPVLEAWNLFFDNTRFPEILTSDVAAVYESLRLGDRLLTETVQRYGLDAFHGAMRYSCDVSAEAMAGTLAGVPDGVYEGEDALDCDAIDDSEEYRIKTRIVKHGDRMEVDFSGSSRQARTSINCGWLDAKTAVSIALAFLFAPETPFTSGSLRNVDIVLPEGTVISALPPDGAIFLYWEPMTVVISAIFQALEPALGPRSIAGDYGALALHNVNGVRPDGRIWVSVAELGGEHGPWGATSAGDADSYTVFYSANNMDPPTETIEAANPVVKLNKEYVTDSAGAGKHRGGASLLHDVLYMEPGEHRSMLLRIKNPCGFGVYGGGDGIRSSVVMWEGDGEVKDVERPGLEPEVYKDAKRVAGLFNSETNAPDPEGEFHPFSRTPIWHTEAGAVFRYITSGGGGWGEALERDPQAVLRDVRDEYVSIDGAVRDYGVVVKGDPQTDPEGLELDLEGTEKLRAERRA